MSALNQAINRKAQIVIIASSGKLLELASQEDLPYFKIPSGLQPRYAVFYNLRAIVDLLVELKITDPAIKVELEDIAVQLPDIIKKWLPIVRVKDNLAKQIAMEVSGKSVVIYAGPKLAPAAYKWKISFNENAKQLAWWNSYSEFNHNEFIGWTRQPELKPYAVIELRSNLENPRILKRFEISNKLLSGTKPHSIVINLPGVNLLEDLLYAVALGDFVSIYSAIISGVNPEPVSLIEELKKELAN